jgi:hypothetical protein
MTEPRLSDRDLQRFFAVRTAGAIDPALAERISRSARQTRQRSAFFVLPGGLSAGPMRALALAATLSATVLLLAALAILPGRNPSVTPVPSVPVPPPSSSSSAPPSESPSASPSPSPTPSPTPSGTPEPTRPTAGGLAFLTRDTELLPEPSSGATARETLDADTTRLYVIDGPVEADGLVWWKVLPYALPGAPASPHDVGWVASAAVQSDEPAMLGFVPECGERTIDLTDAEAFPYGPFEAVACFGHDDVTITGKLICSMADFSHVTVGPDWQSVDHLCAFDSPGGASILFVYGDVVFDLVVSPGQPTIGQYRVTGHFDDPQSSTCVGGGLEGEPSDEALAIGCRGLFVATAVQRLDG